MQAVVDWETPRKVQELRLFLRLVILNNIYIYISIYNTIGGSSRASRVIRKGLSCFCLTFYYISKGRMRGMCNSFLSLDRFNAYNLRDNRKAFSRIRGCDTNNESLRWNVSRLGSCKVFYIRWKAGLCPNQVKLRVLKSSRSDLGVLTLGGRLRMSIKRSGPMGSFFKHE